MHQILRKLKNIVNIFKFSGMAFEKMPALEHPQMMESLSLQSKHLFRNHLGFRQTRFISHLKINWMRFLSYCPILYSVILYWVNVPYKGVNWWGWKSGCRNKEWPRVHSPLCFPWISKSTGICNISYIRSF